MLKSHLRRHNKLLIVRENTSIKNNKSSLMEKKKE